MIISMTGYGKASANLKKMTVNAEMRSINSKYLEITPRLPAMFMDREAELKEMIGKSVSRGKVYISVSIEKKTAGELDLKIHPDTVKQYFSLLNDIKKATKIKEEIRLEHLLKFSEIFKVDESEELKDRWEDVKKVIQAAIKDLYRMKLREGKVLQKDIISRINAIAKILNSVDKISAANIKSSKQKLLEKINNLVSDKSVLDNNRLEYELVMLTDKMDITEEVIRAKSHLEYFKKNMNGSELSGRRLNFLVQEINREINTIASKSNNSSISQNVVEMKEELEKIKEQLQNIE